MDLAEVVIIMGYSFQLSGVRFATFTLRKAKISRGGRKSRGRFDPDQRIPFLQGCFSLDKAAGTLY